MKFFLDENFPKTGGQILLELGHEVIDPRGSHLEGSSDADLFSVAQSEVAIFLTTDRDFFHTIPHLHARHEGILVIALRQPNRARIIDRL